MLKWKKVRFKIVYLYEYVCVYLSEFILKLLVYYKNIISLWTFIIYWGLLSRILRTTLKHYQDYLFIFISSVKCVKSLMNFCGNDKISFCFQKVLLNLVNQLNQLDFWILSRRILPLVLVNILPHWVFLAL